MKKFFFGLVALIAITVAEPTKVSAALSELPIGNLNRVVLDSVTNVDFVSFVINTLDQNGNYKKEIYNESFYDLTWSNGKREQFHDIARRSTNELAQALAVKMREIVEFALMRSAKGEIVNLAGEQIAVRCAGERFTIFFQGPFFPFFETVNKVTVTKNAEGTLTVPEDAYKVDFGAGVMRSINHPMFVPGVARARLTLEDGTVLDGPGGINPSGITVRPEYNLAFIPAYFMVGGVSGEYRIWYTNGVEQAFSLSDGKDLTTNPPVTSLYRKLQAPKVVDKGVLLSYEAGDDETIVIEGSLDLKVWKTVELSPSTSSVRPASSEGPPFSKQIRTTTVPRSGEYGFFRVRLATPTELKPADLKQ